MFNKSLSHFSVEPLRIDGIVYTIFDIRLNWRGNSVHLLWDFEKSERTVQAKGMMAAEHLSLLYKKILRLDNVIMPVEIKGTSGASPTIEYYIVRQGGKCTFDVEPYNARRPDASRHLWLHNLWCVDVQLIRRKNNLITLLEVINS